jgi:hypothetical protein
MGQLLREHGLRDESMWEMVRRPAEKRAARSEERVYDDPRGSFSSRRPSSLTP